MTSVESIETRAVIKFCVERGYSATETYKILQETPTKHSISRNRTFVWCRLFKEGRKSLEDEKRSGRRSSLDTTSIDAVKDAVTGDRRVTIKDICCQTDLSYGTVQRILTDKLNMRKVSCRWIPRLLTADNKGQRVRASKKFLAQYRRLGTEFLDKIITTDETWMHLYDPETKEQSRQWKTPASPQPKKARVVKSSGKQMYIFFADRRGMILQHAVPIGQSVNAEYYSKVIFYMFLYRFPSSVTKIVTK